MFASDHTELDAHLATIVAAVRRRALQGLLLGLTALAVSTTLLGFVAHEVLLVGPRALVSLLELAALAGGIALGRFAVTTLRATRLAELTSPASSPVVAALRGDARGVTELGAVRGRASFVAIVLADGTRHDLPLVETEVEPLLRFLQAHVRHARAADLGFRR